MRNFSIRNTKLICPGHELDYIASIITRKENSYYLIGNMNEIEVFLARLGVLRNKIKGIVLTDGAFTNEAVFGIEQIRDSEIPNNINTIVICASFSRGNYDSTRKLFAGYGFQENMQFFQAEVFAMVYEVYALNKLVLDRVEIFTTSYCSLNCKNCIAYIPYFKEKMNVDISMLKNDIDILMDKVDIVRKLKVLGGECLLYPDLVEYLEYISKYRSKISAVRIGINATIVPSEEIFNICKKYGYGFDISDYTEAIGDRSKLELIKNMCIERGITVDVKRTGEQWLDMGFPHNLPMQRDEQQLRNHFFNCAMFCRDFFDGKLYYCCSNFAAVMAGLKEDDSNDSFDFRKDFSKKELLEFELGYTPLGHTTFCNLCRGCSDEVNPFHVKVALQKEN